jgi:hypothetical protein
VAERPASIRELLAELSALAEAVPEHVAWADPQSNRVELEDAAGSGDALATVEGSNGLRELYAECREIVLADVGNGHFVHRAIHVLVDLARGAPVRTLGRHSLEVIPFGSDGGGGRYCLDRASGGIYYLPPGREEDGTYESDAPAFGLVSNSEFLAWLVACCRDPLAAHEPRE